MICSLDNGELLDYIRRQLNHFFYDKYDFKGNDVKIAYEIALERTENCFKTINMRGYHDDRGNVFFSHLHGDQYATFLYFLSNSLYNYSQNKVLCDKLLQLNKLLSQIFISYKCNMPDHFFLGHPVGTILGNADYGDYLVVFQGVTVNTSEDNNGNPAPHIGKGVFLGTNCKIIGNMQIGDYSSIGVDALVYNKDIPDNSVVMNIKGDNCFIRSRIKDECMAQRYFDVKI